jgi:ABC-type transport system involved in cytochrome c biogenesis ATPase subunit
MHTLLNFVIFELKGIFRTKKWIPLVFIFVAFWFSIFQGIGYYKKSNEIISEFLELELETFKSYTNHILYSNMGFKVIVEPASSEIFFSSPSKLLDMRGRVNSIAALEINSNNKGTSIFTGNTSFKIAFSQLVLYLGSLLVFLLGADPFQKKEYFRFLSGMCRSRTLFFYVIAARIILLSVIFILFFAGLIIFTLLMGINLDSPIMKNLVKYGILTISTLLFFFAAGTITGIFLSHKVDNKKPHNYSLAIWFLLLFVLPGITNLVNSTNEKNANSSNRLKSDQLKIIDEFEDEVLKKYGKVDPKNLKPFRKAAEHYYNEYYPKVEKIEIDELQKVSDYYKKYNLASMFIPTASYNAISNELSGKGYLNYLSFHRYLIEVKRRFLRFWLDWVYYKDYKVMVNFVQDRENVFKAQSRIPEYFWLAVLLNCFYSIAFLSVAFVFFRRWLFRFEEKDLKKIETGEIDLNSKPYIFGFQVSGNALRNYLFQVLSGNPRKYDFSGKLVLLKDRQDISQSTPNFLYVCKKEYLPKNIRVIEFLKLICSMNKIKNHRLQELLNDSPLKDVLDLQIGKLEDTSMIHLQMFIPLLVEKPVYLIDYILPGMKMAEASVFIEKIDSLSKRGQAVIYITEQEKFKPAEKNIAAYGQSATFYYDLKARSDVN